MPGNSDNLILFAEISVAHRERGQWCEDVWLYTIRDGDSGVLAFIEKSKINVDSMQTLDLVLPRDR